MKSKEITYREVVLSSDREHVRQLVESSGVFSTEEISIAIELVEERLLKGSKSGYFFLFAETEGNVIGYTCFGPIPGTEYSYDIYWIATHNDLRGQGIGKILLQETEKRIAAIGGHNIYLETASKPQYAPTRKFYENSGYFLEAQLKQFYADDDDKCIYVKRV